VTADIVSIFSDIWKLGPETPRLLYCLRAALRLMLDTQGTTLLDTRRILSDDTFRIRLLRKCTDKETRQTWTEFDAKDKKQQAQEISRAGADELSTAKKAASGFVQVTGLAAACLPKSPM
jgi:hypothetical protein